MNVCDRIAELREAIEHSHSLGDWRRRMPTPEGHEADSWGSSHVTAENRETGQWEAIASVYDSGNMLLVLKMREHLESLVGFIESINNKNMDIENKDESPFLSASVCSTAEMPTCGALRSRPMQIQAASQPGDGNSGPHVQLFALCEDGSIWVQYNSSGFSNVPNDGLWHMIQPPAGWEHSSR